MGSALLVFSVLIIGLLPSLFWLWFWLREDKAKPEPGYLIVSAFIAGMVVIPLAIALEGFSSTLLTGGYLIFSWAVIEETLKYVSVLIVVMWHKEVDEPIDCIIYLIAIALGFATLENILFIWEPMQSGQFIDSLLTSKFRFLGAVLLHVLTSGTIGIMMALAFYKPLLIKFGYSALGLFMAIVLHALFNFFIIDTNGEVALGVFLFVWVGIITLLFAFELVKLKEKQHQSQIKKI